MIQDFFSLLRHPDQLIAWGGYGGLTAIVFCETGVLAGFFLPGDSLLVTAGLVASQGKIDIFKLNALLIVAAIAGDSVGYWIGAKLGPKIFNREDSFFFHKSHVERTHQFFDRYGAKTIVLARFVPIVRTFAPTMAGVGGMAYRRFISYNIVGGVLWVAGMTSIGYFLGKAFPNIEKSLHWVILTVIFVSFLPIFWEFFVAKKKK